MKALEKIHTIAVLIHVQIFVYGYKLGVLLHLVDRATGI